MNWLNARISEDSFGRVLLGSGVSAEKIREWSVDPRINLDDGGQGSIFDTLEDMDAAECR